MAVIIADMNEVPMNCFECDLHNYHFCNLTGNCIESNIDDNTRADDCPLKEVNDNSVLEQIKEEIEEKGFNSPMMNPVFTMTEILEIIDKYIIGEEQGEAG